MNGKEPTEAKVGFFSIHLCLKIAKPTPPTNE